MRKERLVSIGRFAAKLGGTCLILGMGAILLDPGMLAVFKREPEFLPAHIIRPDAARPEEGVPARPVAWEYRMETPGADIHYRSEFFNGTWNAARMHIVHEMRRMGFSPLELHTRGNGFPVMAFRKGNALTGVMLRKTGRGVRIVYAETVSGSHAPECPAMLRGLAAGRILLCMRGNRNTPLLVTGSPAGTSELEKQLTARLRRNGWVQEKSLSYGGAATPGTRLIQARKGHLSCNIFIAPGNGELSGLNTVTYRLTMI